MTEDRGTLSAAEFQGREPAAAAPRDDGIYTRDQMEEDLLYFDLDVCARLRRAMERLNPWGDEFLFTKIERDSAMESARGRLAFLRARDYLLSGDIAERCLWEGA